jgi:uroporphyrinogen decarboxylase
MLLDEVGEEVDVLHTVFSPLSVVGRLCGPEARFQQYASEDPASAHGALAAATETLSEYAEAALDAGAAGIFFAPLRWASRDVCSEDFYREYGRPYDLQLLAGIRDAEVNVLHVCRDHNMIDLLLDYPVAALNWADHGDGNPSLAEVMGRTDKAVMGGVDHTHLHEMSASDVAEQARAALAAGPARLILSAGCSIPPATPEANRAAIVAAAREG